MTSLALANLRHHKLRSALAGLAVAIGIAMLVTMLSLSHGTLREVAQRVKTVQAELVVLPSKSSLIFSEGAPLSDKYISKLAEVKVGAEALAGRTIPVFLSMVPNMAGQQQRVFGIDPDDFDAFCRRRKVVAGQLFPEGRRFKAYVASLQEAGGGIYHPNDVPEAILTAASELIIDARLAEAGGYQLGDAVDFLGRRFTICAIVEEGLAGRVFTPIQVLRHIQNAGLPWSSTFFIQLNRKVVRVEGDGTAADRGKLTVAQAAERLSEATRLRIASLEQYDQMLFDSFRSIYVFINIANGIVLFVSFLFIMVTIYTMVLERRREIGILRSLGAGGGYIMRQTTLEALMISLVGTAVGMGLAVISKFLIEHYRPLLTVDIEGQWLILAVAVGVLGGSVSALYPGYRALRLDPVECLTYE